MTVLSITRLLDLGAGIQGSFWVKTNDLIEYVSKSELLHHT